MHLAGYLVYLLLHLLFKRITWTLNTANKVRWEQSKVTRNRATEKDIIYLNSKQGACNPMPPRLRRPCSIW